MYVCECVNNPNVCARRFHDAVAVGRRWSCAGGVSDPRPRPRSIAREDVVYSDLSLQKYRIYFQCGFRAACESARKSRARARVMLKFTTRTARAFWIVPCVEEVEEEAGGGNREVGARAMPVHTLIYLFCCMCCAAARRMP